MFAASGGQWAIAWSGNGGNWVNRYSGSGDLLGTVRLPTVSGYYLQGWAMDGDGGLVATCVREYDGNTYVVRYDGAGRQVGSAWRANTTALSYNGGYYQGSSVGVDSAGNFLVAWTGQDGSGTGIFAQRYRVISPNNVQPTVDVGPDGIPP